MTAATKPRFVGPTAVQLVARALGPRGAVLARSVCRWGEEVGVDVTTPPR